MSPNKIQILTCNKMSEYTETCALPFRHIVHKEELHNQYTRACTVQWRFPISDKVHGTPSFTWRLCSTGHEYYQ